MIKMKTRNLSVDDAEKVYDAFRLVSIDRGQENAPDYGFYDYPLKVFDFEARLYDGRLSIALEDKGKLVAYMLAYGFWQIPDLDTGDDLVLSRLKGDSELIYLDQLFMKPGLPAHVAGRLLDIWTNLALGYTRQGVVTAIPQKPWRNVPSTRFAIHRGFRRQRVVREGDLEIGIFTKPFWELGGEISNVALDVA